MKHRQNHKGAFTLLEVLLALMIFSVVIIAATEALTVQLRAQNRAEETTRAVLLAENLLEELRYQTFLEEEEREGKFDGMNAGYKWWYSIEQTDIKELNKVTVRISADDGRQLHEVEVYLTIR